MSEVVKAFHYLLYNDLIKENKELKSNIKFLLETRMLVLLTKNQEKKLKKLRSTYLFSKETKL
jgi:hypothetical protein